MINIHIIGDSTAANKSLDKRPETGWGEMLSNFFRDGVKIINHAMNGRSTKSFIDEGLFKKVLDVLKPNDFLLIQFGHNDEKINDLSRYTEPFGKYQENIAYFIDEAKKIGATPIVLSSVTRRLFIGKHRIKRYAIGLYPNASKFLASRKSVIHLDIFTKTKKLFEYLDNHYSKRLFLHLNSNEHENYPLGASDNTHLSHLGALTVASFVAEELLFTKTEHKLKDYIDESRLINMIDVKRALK